MEKRGMVDDKGFRSGQSGWFWEMRGSLNSLLLQFRTIEMV